MGEPCCDGSIRNSRNQQVSGGVRRLRNAHRHSEHEQLGKLPMAHRAVRADRASAIDMIDTRLCVASRAMGRPLKA